MSVGFVPTTPGLSCVHSRKHLCLSVFGNILGIWLPVASCADVPRLRPISPCHQWSPLRIRDTGHRSSAARCPKPIRYGMTVGACSRRRRAPSTRMMDGRARPRPHNPWVPRVCIRGVHPANAVRPPSVRGHHSQASSQPAVWPRNRLRCSRLCRSDPQRHERFPRDGHGSNSSVRGCPKNRRYPSVPVPPRDVLWRHKPRLPDRSNALRPRQRQRMTPDGRASI